ncbi:hypothetical protein C1H21_22060 [Xanthomonas arboricola pv. juglandis]|nr:hypothetical protein C1H21_22060 [Xanthomonas arboricola pv. juglandis]
MDGLPVDQQHQQSRTGDGNQPDVLRSATAARAVPRDDDQSAEMDALKTVLTQFLSSCRHPVPVGLARGMPGA